MRNFSLTVCTCTCLCITHFLAPYIVRLEEKSIVVTFVVTYVVEWGWLDLWPLLVHYCTPIISSVVSDFWFPSVGFVPHQLSDCIFPLHATSQVFGSVFKHVLSSFLKIRMLACKIAVFRLSGSRDSTFVVSLCCFSVYASHSYSLLYGVIATCYIEEELFHFYILSIQGLPYH